jgi:hypothetical protein
LDYFWSRFATAGSDISVRPGVAAGGSVQFVPWDYGSQHQLRRWILERPDAVNRDLLSRNPELAAWAETIEWISPTAASTVELRDQAWATAGLSEPSPRSAGWWPAGGAVWDAVARVHGTGGETGAIFLEAKGREGELTSGGCKATAPQSLETIRSALADVQASLGVTPSPEWMGACYQPANRLATLWFAREKRQPPAKVWLVSMYFLGEHYPTVKQGEPHVGPTTEDAWEPIIAGLHSRMGLPAHPHLLSDWWIESFLPALEPSRRPT